jgi:hypothetical protein
MGTPARKLESKYSIEEDFTEGETSRCAATRKNSCSVKLFCARVKQLA